MHDVAAVLSRPRADIDNVVGHLHGVLIVFDDEHGVSQVAHPDQGFDEALVISLMQPNRRLVEHVQHPNQPRPNLRCQSDPLGLTPGEGRRVARHRQVVETNVEEESESSVDLFQDLLGNDRLIAEFHSARVFAASAIDIEQRSWIVRNGHAIDSALRPPSQTTHGTCRM